MVTSRPEAGSLPPGHVDRSDHRCQAPGEAGGTRLEHRGDSISAALGESPPRETGGGGGFCGGGGGAGGDGGGDAAGENGGRFPRDWWYDGTAVPSREVEGAETGESGWEGGGRTAGAEGP
jgi:hypothetical protein